MKNMYILLVAVSFLTITACEKDGDFDMLHWNISKGVLTISGQGEMKNFGEHERKPWEFHSNDIKHIVIEEGVTTIGNYAFYGLSILSSVNIPRSVKKIGYASFEKCAFVKITIPSSVDYIGSWAFTKCPLLEIIVFEGPVELMGSNVFTGWGYVRRGYILELQCPPFAVHPEFFRDFDFDKSFLIVPKGTKELFDVAPGWQDFKNITEK